MVVSSILGWERGLALQGATYICPTRGDASLDLVVTNAGKLIGDVKTGGSPGCSDHALAEFAVLNCYASRYPENGGS